MRVNLYGLGSLEKIRSQFSNFNDLDPDPDSSNFEDLDKINPDPHDIHIFAQSFDKSNLVHFIDFAGKIGL